MPKLRNLTNRNLIKDFIKDLQEETGFHFYDIKFGNGYFVFEYDKDSICHFKIKEIPGFLFAIWLSKICNLKEYGHGFIDAELYLFSQPILTLDKFKPTRCALIEPASRNLCKPNDSKVWEEYWMDYGAVRMLKFMKKHRYLAYHIGKNDYYDEWDRISEFKAFIEYISDRFYYFKEDLKTNLKNKFIVKDLIRRFKKLDFCRVTISDYGECFSPRIHVKYYEPNNITDEQDKASQALYDYIEDKYWNDVDFQYITTAERFRQIANYRISADKKKKEVLLWKKMP